MSYSVIRPEILNREFLLVEEENIADALTEAVLNHQGSVDDFSPYPFDPDFEIHRYDCVGLIGINADASELRELSASRYGGTDKLFDTVASRKHQSTLHEIYEAINLGDDIAILTDHSSVIGTALGGGAIAAALYEHGFITPDDVEFNLVASAMIKHTKIFGAIPTAEVIPTAFSRTTFTLPSSPSIRGSNIPRLNREAFNTASLAELKKLQENKKPIISFIAGSGHRDKKILRTFGKSHHPATIHMGPPATGTTEMLQNMRIIELGIDIQTVRPKLYLGTLDNPPKQPRDLNRSMKRIAREMTKRTGVERIFHDTRDSYDKAVNE